MVSRRGVVAVAIPALFVVSCSSSNDSSKDSQPTTVPPDTSTAAAEALKGNDPIWVVTQFLNQRVNKQTVPTYPYVCPTGRPWSPAGVDSDEVPLSESQSLIFDIVSFDPKSMRAEPARNPAYRVVTVRVKGREREEDRNFLLGPLTDLGFCVGDVT